jgi:hypothetical protein
VNAGNDHRGGGAQHCRKLRKAEMTTIIRRGALAGLGAAAAATVLGSVLAVAPAGGSQATQTMYDASVTRVSHIPPGADVVAYGPKWTNAEVDQDFPASLHVAIGDSATDYSRPVVDFESKYVFTCSGLVQWIQGHQTLGQGFGTVYTWHGNIATVQSCLAGWRYYLWVADQTGTEHSWPGSNVVATQWCGGGNCPGNPYVDESLVTAPGLLGG